MKKTVQWFFTGFFLGTLVYVAVERQLTVGPLTIYVME